MTDFNEMSDREVDEYLGEHCIGMGIFFYPKITQDKDVEHWLMARHPSGKAVAIISRDVEDGSPIDLEVLYVLESARRTGIGKDFIRQLATEYGRLSGEFVRVGLADFFEKAGCRVNREIGIFYLPKI